MKIFKTLFVAMLFGIIATGCDVLINPKANMVVSQGSIDIESIIGVFDFGKVEVGKSKTVIFKIRNTGKKALHLTGTPFIEVVGNQYINFPVTAQPHTTIKQNDWTTFQIRCIPSESKFYSALIYIISSDPNKNPYTFAIKGRGIIIDINVRQDTTHIPNDTGLFDFGSIYLGNTGPTYSFTIENIGSAILNLIGSPQFIKIQGPYSAEFEIDQTSTNSSLNPAETTTFSIIFKPTKIGVKTAKIFFENTDPDENPYNFTIRGSCIDPEIQVLDHEMNNIPNGTGEYDFGATYDGNKISRTFTIRNLGTTNLNLYHTPIVTVTHISAYAFVVEKQPDRTIAPGSKTTFVISFKPDDSKIYSATISFFNNDEYVNPFTFKIIATGYIPNFDFNGDGIDDIIVGAFDDDTTGEDSGIAYLYFGKPDYPSNIICTEADVTFKSYKGIIGFGLYVANAGDVNNDGYDDVLIGTDGLSSRVEDTGNAYLFFGSHTPPTEISINKADVIFNGFGDYDCYDSGVSSAGDFNGDGFDDVILGAHAENKRSGAAFIFFGKSNWGSKLDSSDADVKLYGPDCYDFGRYFSYAGDFNHDGFDDVIVSTFSYKGVYVFLGESNPPNQILASEADVIITTKIEQGYYYYFALEVSYAGDFNNDGIDDIILLERKWIQSTNQFFDKVYIFFGSQYPSKALNTVNADVTFENDDPDRSLGYGCNYAGDVNNDGIDDIIIGETGPKGSTNKAYIFYGSSSPQKHLKNTDADVIIPDIPAWKDGTGWITAGCAGDLNNDQIDDFFVSSFVYNGYGKVFIAYGKSNLSPSIPSSNVDLIIYDTKFDTNFGASISGGK